MSEEEEKPSVSTNVGPREGETDDGDEIVSDAPTTLTPAPFSPVAAPTAEGGARNPDVMASALGGDVSDEASGANKAVRKGRVAQSDLPQELGRYTLVERLGVGGMAEVFRATQPGVAGFTKTVVVKRILPHLAVDDRFVDMFFREAKVAADLAHPNIIQIHELGEAKGTYFIVMEYLQGLSLFQLARRAWRAQRSIPMELAVYAIADAAEGLHYAYYKNDSSGEALNLIHRDISPDNLIMTTQAQTKVVDFGIAKAANTENLTKTGEMKGKIPYMPRELLEPGGELDHRSDLYALGITLYWMLTGQRPYRGETDLQVMQAIVRGDAQRPSSINAAIPRALEEITLSLIARDQDARPDNGKEVANALLGLVGAQRDGVAAFVRDMVQEPALKRGERPHTTSGFLPAVPITGTLAAAQHTKPEPADLGLDVNFETAAGQATFEMPPATPMPEGVLASSMSAPGATSPSADGRSSRAPILVALAAAAVLLGVGAIFISGGEEPTPEVMTPPAGIDEGADPADDATDDGAADDGATDDGATDDSATGGAQGEAEQVGDDGDALQKGSEADADDGEDGENVVEADPSAVKPKPKTKPRTRRRASRPRAPKLAEVKAKAPGYIRWLDAAGKRVGKGSGTLKVPAGSKTLYALDTRRGVKSPATVSGGKVDYGAIPQGTLVVRVFPFAEMVSIGGQQLGPTPMKALKVKVGTYKVKVTKGGKTETRTVKVAAGRTAVVKVKL